MAYTKNNRAQDEVKGRECADYIKEFCPERPLTKGPAILFEQETEKTDDDFQFSL